MSLDKLFSRKKPILPMRLVHLDLKGLPPTFERLLETLKIFAAARYNAVLVEWEDQFPWTVDDVFRSPTAYTPQQVKQFHSAAAKLGLEIIPLVQCLGHLEWVLTPKGRENLREVPHKSDVLNPLAGGARELIEALVDDVLSLSPGIRYFHLGGDEAWTLGTHPDTKAFIQKYGKGTLYMKHIEPFLRRLLDRGVRPILWHDMMIEWGDDVQKNLAGKADLMVWGYAGHPDKVDAHYNTRHIEKFARNGVTMWGAAAYKGADGQNADLPNIEKRQINALAWAEVALRFGFKGVLATAWSRYSGHRGQNEPIDGSLDSLLNVGVILHDGRPPKGGIEACREALGAIGERKRFDRTYTALQKLTEARKAAWGAIQDFREQKWLEHHEPHRQMTEISSWAMNELERSLLRADEAVRDVRSALAGAVPDVWIEEYICERIEPIRQICAELKSRG